MKSEVSAIILTKDEEYSLVSCVAHLLDFVDEIIVIDSSESDLTRTIASDMGCSVYEFNIDGEKVKGFGDLRNIGNELAKHDWCLHVDVDEIFSNIFLENINTFINNNPKVACFRFPRINLPFYEKYPDYQVRLANKKYTTWSGKVHEKVVISNNDFKEFTLSEYPIVHKNKQDKIIINKRWKNLMENNKILIISMFKDSELYISQFLEYLSNAIKYGLDKGYVFKVSFLESSSEDDTHYILERWLSKIENVNVETSLINLNISNTIERFDKLAILRNMSIKLSLKDEDYVLTIDSDTIFDNDLIVNLIDSLKNSDCDVVAPMVFIDDFRTYGDTYFYDTLAFIKNKKNISHFYPYFCVEDSKSVQSRFFDKVMLDSVGTCYLANSKIYNINDFNDYNILKCFDELSKGKIPVIYEGDGVSEQVRFFNNVNKAKHRVYVDTNIKIRHVNFDKLGLEWH